jgi:signal-transduction protein with cAMP-binding, CBS, and nucleotidyltransferase domain
MARDEDRPPALPDLLAGPEAWQDLVDEASEMGTADRRMHLSGPSGRVAVDLTATIVRDEAGRAQYLDCLLEAVTHEEQRAAEREALVRRLQGAMLFVHEPVSDVPAATVFCAIDDGVGAVARKMTARGSTVALVRSEGGEVVGVFTDRDLRERVIAAGLDLQTPVGRVMTAPVASIPDHAEIYEALVAMEERGVQHLGVEDRSGQITAVIRHRELLQFPSYGPMVLAREIAHAETADEAIDAALRAPGLAEALTDSGAPPDRVTRMLTSVCDSATERFIELAQNELGEPPATFCFLGLGSHGREELTPGSDQDNALIYADEAAGDDEIAEYFLALGRRVCGWLDEAGFPYCRGEIMAQTPRWSQPLSQWREYFSEWIRVAEPMEVLEFVAFFDFRPVYGDRSLADALRAHVLDEAASHPAFFAQLARSVMRFKPPMQLFGRIIGGAAPGGDAQMLNIKDTMGPIIAFARVYALRERIEDPNTLERLEGIAEAGEMADASHEETVGAFGNLMRMRLQQQADAIEAGQQPDNIVGWRDLDEVERTLVSQAFAQVQALQKRVSHDFLGDT